MYGKLHKIRKKKKNSKFYFRAKTFILNKTNENYTFKDLHFDLIQ